MTLNEVLVIMQNRIISLSEARKASVVSGDLERVAQIDADLVSTWSTVEKISGLLNSSVAE